MKQFHQQIAEIFDYLEACMDEWLNKGWDYDRHEGTLTIISPAGMIWLLNQHEPSQQLWLSSPITGAHHFVIHSTDHWISTQDPEQELKSLLNQEMSAV